MKQPRNQPRGFATVMALVSLSLVGVTIAGLMTHISMQARRTELDATRAQREQIVIARSLSSSIILPPELRDGSHF